MGAGARCGWAMCCRGLQNTEQLRAFSEANTFLEEDGGELSGRRQSCAQRWYGNSLFFPEAMLAWIITRTRDCSSFGKSALGHTAGISPRAKPRLSRLGEVGEKLVPRHHNAACREANGSFYMLREGRTSAPAPQGSRVYSLWTLIPKPRQISPGTVKINFACVTTCNNVFYLVDWSGAASGSTRHRYSSTYAFDTISEPRSRLLTTAMFDQSILSNRYY
jgi:hypothetical protein